MTDQTGKVISLIRRALPPLVLIIVTVVVIAVLKMSSTQSERQKTIQSRPLVSTQVVQPGNYQPQLELYGQVESPSRVVLSAAITAFVGQVTVREGTEVQQGELLVELDPRDAELQMLQSSALLSSDDARIAAERTRYRSELEILKKEQLLLEIAARGVDRQQSLQSKNLSSRTQLDDAVKAQTAQSLSVTRMELSIADHSNRLAQLEAQRSKSLAALQKAELDLSRASIVSPFTARVIEVSVAEGARVKTGDALLTLFAVDQLEVRAQIPARYLPVLRQSLRAGYVTQGVMQVDGQTIPVAMDRMASSVSSGRGGVDALFSIDMNGDHFVEIGRSVVLQVQLPEVANIVAVPAQAIYADRRVYLIEEQQLKAVEVEKVGEWLDQDVQWVLIKGPGIVEGALLMTTQLPGAITGMKVDTGDTITSPSSERTEG